MKITKTIKLLAITAISFLLIGASLFSLNLSKVNAHATWIEVSSGAEIEYVKAGEVQDEKYYTSVPVNDGETISIVNNLDIADFEMQIYLNSDITGASVTLKGTSYFENGVLNEEEKYSTSIENVVNLEYEEDKWMFSLNEQEAVEVNLGADYSVNLSLVVENGYLTAAINGENQTEFASKYKLKDVLGICSAGITIDINTISGIDGSNILIEYIDQKASDQTGNFKQTFEFDDNLQLINKAYPRVGIGENFVTGSRELYVGVDYTCTFSVCSVLGNVSTDKLSLGVPDGVWKHSELDKFKITEVGEKAISILYTEDEGAESVICEEYVFGGVEMEEDESAPVYILDEEALQNFKDVLENSLYTDYVVGGESVRRHIRIGSSEYLTLPSLRNVVSDNATTYNNLSYTLHYYLNDSTSESTSSSLKIPITSAGKYLFFICFKDQAGNEMKATDFYNADETDTHVCAYSDFVFTFYVYDDAPLSIRPSTQDKGYVSAEYRASAFIIEGSGYNTEYTLYYKVGEEWKEISAVNDYNENNYVGYFSYDEMKAFNYDGELTFTPQREGTYRLECEIYSQLYNGKGAISAVEIQIDKPADVVTPDDHWWQDNMWSVIFLGVGSLSLIGIIVLLFIKPKDVVTVKSKNAEEITQGGEDKGKKKAKKSKK